MVEMRVGLDTLLAAGALCAPVLALGSSRHELGAIHSQPAVSPAWPAVSGDGQRVVFSSAETTLVSHDINGVVDVFVHDSETNAVELVSVSSGGTQTNGDSFNPSISSDGRFVAFWSCANNLDVGDTNGLPDLFVHDRRTGATRRVTDLVCRSLASSDTARTTESRPADLRRASQPIDAWSWTDVFDEDPDAMSLLLLRRPESGREDVNSPPQSGTIPPPGDFELTDPMDFAPWGGTSMIPIPFTWTASTDHDGYTLEISDDSAFAVVDFSFPVAADTTTHELGVTTLTYPRVYYWRVRATNAGGSTTASNAPFRLDVINPAATYSVDDSMVFCFVATAAYGSPMEPEVQTLRSFRDRVLLPTAPGRAFVGWYYRTSPPLAAAIAEQPLRRSIARAFLWPVVGFAKATLWTGEHLLGAAGLAAALIAAGWSWTRFARGRRRAPSPR